MRADELDALERSLHITLPSEVRATLLAPPFGPSSDVIDIGLLETDAARLQELNEGHRGTVLPTGPWPHTAFVLGENGGEAAYVLDLSRVPAVIQEFSFETKAFTDHAPTWAAWLDRLAETERELQADEAFEQERYRTRKWWQFWIRPYPPRATT
jgi:hypothetical protein